MPGDQKIQEEAQKNVPSHQSPAAEQSRTTLNPEVQVLGSK